MSASKTENAKNIAREIGILRAKDFAAHGISRAYIYRLQKMGILERTGQGLYKYRNANITESHSIAEACKKVPQGVVCLLSALRLHGLTTQNPFEVWMAIDRKSFLPKSDSPKIRIVRYSGEALTAGIEIRKIEGVTVKVYGVAKTVADCFKYRNKIGLDVSLEVLRDSLKKRSCTVDDLWRYAKICRVANVMRPYLEATV